MAEFRAAKNLNQLAARLVVDQVRRAADDIEEAARANAPASKTWVTRGDAVVRPEHRKANNQAVPENVRYQIKTPQYDQEHYDPHEYQLLRFPRDEVNGTPGNTANCRCESLVDPEGVRQNINASSTRQQGTKVIADVIAKFNRIEEAEYGANGDPGLRFMGRALTEVAAKYRA